MRKLLLPILLIFLPLIGFGQCSPGNVGNMFLWLKGDGQINGSNPITGWLDQSGNGRNLNGGTSSPKLVNGGLNYNPLVKFDGISNYMVRPGGILGGSVQQNFYIYMVTKTNATATNQYIFNEKTLGSSATRIAGVLPEQNLQIISDFGDTTSTGRAWTNWIPGVADTSQYYIWSFNNSSTYIGTPSGGNKAIYVNGQNVSNVATSSTVTGMNSVFYFGSQTATTGFFNGQIAEFIIINSAITANQQRQIHSYLAAKYGISLYQGIPQDYLASDGITTFWTSMLGGIFNNGIAAIGRDDNSCLNQKQSQGFKDIVSIGLGTITSTNLTNPNSFGANYTFLSWGNNNGALTLQYSNLPSLSYVSRLSREWQVQTTGTVGGTQLNFNLSGLSLASIPQSNLFLIVDNDGDGDFTTGSVTSFAASSLSNNILTFKNINFSNGVVFTIGTSVYSPGGVLGNGLKSWYKANGSILFGNSTISGWNNEVSAGANLPNVLGQPVFSSSGFNFNPTVYFGGNASIYSSSSVLGSNFFSTNANSSFIVFTNAVPSTTAGVLAKWEDITNSNLNRISWEMASNGGLTFSFPSSTYGVVKSTSNLSSVPCIGSAVTISNNDSLSINGTFQAVTNVTTNTSNINTNGVFKIGANNNTLAYPFTGNIAEIIHFNTLLSKTNQQKVISYLALKYGITLNQTTPTNYLSSDGVTYFWNASLAGLYNNNIAGIGRDDASSLLQLQSQSQSNPNFDILTIGLGTIASTNLLNPSSISSNLSYMTWANNNGLLSEQTTELPSPTNAFKRLTREWQIQETGTIGAVQLNFNLNNATVTGTTAADFTLLVDSDGDGDFSTGPIAAYPASSFNSNILTFLNINFNNGDYFTISTMPKSPGGLLGTFLWLDATRGVSGSSTVTGWADQSGNSKNMTNGINSNPVLTASAINFNPSIYFNGTTDYMSLAPGILGTSTYPEINTYIVSRTLDTSSPQYLLYESTNNLGGTPKFSIQLPGTPGSKLEYDCGNGQSSPPSAGRIAVNWGGNTSNFFLWSLNSSIGTSTPSGSQKAIYSNGKLLASNTNSFSMKGNNNPFSLASGNNSSGGFNGLISELIIFNTSVSGLAQSQIQSYLALKYGITLDQTTSNSYVASDGTTLMWDASLAGSYNKNIAGIGRDDASSLLQLQSQSNPNNDILSIGLGTIASSNMLNISTIPSNLSFMSWSSSGTLTEQSTGVSTLTGCIKRFNRAWKIYETGTIGNVQVSINLNNLTVTGTSINDFNLLINSAGDGTFSTGTTSVITASSFVNNTVTFNNVNFTNGNIFTFTTSSVASVSMGGIISSPSSIVCAGSNAGTLTLSGFVGSILNWQTSTNNFASTQTISNTSFTQAFNNLTTTTSFQAVVQNSVCPSTTSGIFTITVNGISLGGNISGTTSDVCASANNGTLTLSGFYGNILNWQSSTNNFASTQTISNTAFTQNFNNLTTTTGYQAVVQNGVCPATTSGIFTITVNGISIGGSVSGLALPVCVGSNNGTLTLVGYNGSILSWQSSTNNFASTQTISNTAFTQNFNNLTTTTSFQAVVQNGVCSSTVSGIYTVTVNGISVGGGISGPASPVCAGSNTGTLTLSGFYGNILNWLSSSNNFATTQTISNSSFTQNFNNLTTTTSFQAVVQNGVCSSTTSGIYTVTVNGTSVGGSISGPALPVCAGSNAGTLTLSGYNGNIIYWQSSTNNFATTQTISNTAFTQNFSNLTTTTSFRAVVQNGVCSSTTSGIYTVTVNGTSVGGSISGPALPVCAGSNAGTLTISGYNGNIIYWQSSTNNFATTQTISNTAFTQNFNNLTTTTGFQAIVQNGVCSSTTSGIFTVTVNGISVGGSISGPASPVCAGSNVGTLTLSGYNGNIIYWQSSTNNFATTQTISNTAFAQNFNNLTTTTSFQAVVQNGVCSSTTSGIYTVTVNGISIGGNIIGPSFSVCTGSNTGTLTLTGYNGNILNWQSSADNFLTITTISNTAFTNSFTNLTTTTSFRAIIQNNFCPSTLSGIATVTINGASVGGNPIAPNNMQCAGSNAGTITLTGYTGSVINWQSSIDNFATVSTISNTNFTQSFNNLTTTTSYRALIQNGACTSTLSGIATVTVAGVSVGGSISAPGTPFCSGTNTGTLTLTGYNGTILNWQSSTDNFATLSTISNSAFTYSFANITTTTSFRATIQNSVCSPTTSNPVTVSIVGISIPGSISGPIVSQCSGANSGTLTLTGFNGSILNWQSSTDNFATTTTILSSSNYLPFNNLTLNTSYVAVVQNGICPSTTSGQFTVSVSGVSVGGSVVGQNSPLCSNSNAGTLTLTGYNGNILNWQSSIDNFTTVNTISSTAFIYSFANLTTTTSFRAVVINGFCSAAYSSAFDVTVSGISLGGILSGPSNVICSGPNSGTLTLSGFNGIVQNWQSSNDNFTTTQTIPNTFFIYSFSNLTTTTSFNVMVQNGGCPSTTSGIFTVSVSGPSMGGIISGPSLAQCSGSNSGTLTLSGYSGSIINWQSSIDNFATAQVIPNTSSTYSFSNLSSTTGFEVVIQNGACVATTSGIFIVSVDGITIAGNLSGPTIPQCSGTNSGTLTLTGFNGSIINWQSTTDNFTSTQTISSTSFTYDFANLTTTTSFNAVVQNGTCGSATSNVFTVSVTGVSIGGILTGPSIQNCAGSNSGTLTLSGYNGSISNWLSSTDNFNSSQTIANTLSTFDYSNLTTATSFQVVVQNGLCPIVYSGTFTVSVNGVSIGGNLSGPSIQQCSGTNSGTLTLTGFNGSIVNWQSSTDNFNTSQNISNTTFTNSFVNLTTTTSYSVTVQNGNCSPVTSGIFMVTVGGLSVGGNLTGTSGLLCAGSNVGTLTLTGYNGSISGWESSIDNFATVNPIANSLPTYTFNNLSSTTSFRVNVVSGSCATAVSSIQTINIVPSSNGGAIAGPIGNYCSGSNAGTLTLSGYVGSVVDWESSLDNFATYISLGNTSTTLDFTNLSVPTCYRAVIQNGSCPTVKSSIFLINIPSANAGVLTGPTNAFCSTGNSGTLSISGNTNPIIRWESSTDNLSFASINTTSNTYSFSNLLNTTYFRVVEQNSQCPIITSNLFTVSVSPPPIAGVLTGGSTLAVGPNSGTLQLNNYSGGVIRWEESSDSLMAKITPISNTSPQQNYTNLTVTTYYRAVVTTPGCSAVYSNVTGVILSELVIYTGFSPDGDGKNETWVIDNILLYPNNKVKIYNRWGNLVYQESGYDNDQKVWDGRCNTGLVLGNQTLPEGTYYYVISISGFPDMSGYLLLNK